MSICQSLIPLTYLPGFLSAVVAVVSRGLVTFAVGVDFAVTTTDGYARKRAPSS